ncbi:type IV pili methyl-accepting chemotaxis transducer N-terminal domain-containing protein [Ideonella sp. DXS29W]|uniref:Sensor protein n=1 Tax=Ideonella lacteola TaxID=2984193 RepID=A0ABU9BNF5_9BURK
MATPRSLALRLVLTGVVFLAVALASITVSLWVTWQLEGGAAAVNEAGRMRMMTYRMAFDVSQGRREALPLQIAAFERTLALLRDGDPSRPLFVPSSDDTRAGLARANEAWAVFNTLLTHDAQVDAAPAATLVSAIDNLVQAIEQRLAYWTSALRAFQLTMVALAVIGAMLLLYTSHITVLDPLRRLGAAIAALRGGHLSARVDAMPSAEFQELADGFNTMAERLEAQYATLEETVRLKTADLQAQRERLSALYEVSAFIATADTLDDMAKGFVQKVRRIARADGMALRWSDADNRRYLLLAHEGLPPTFAAEEQCLSAGDCHCGQAGRGSIAPASRVIPIRDAVDGHGRCQKAGFQTLLTIPVSLHHRIHGEIDLFYRTGPDSTDIDQSLIELLASHLAGGMEGLRSAAVEKEAAVSNERGLLAQELHDSIAQSLAFLKIQVQLLRGALGRRDQPGIDRSMGEIETGVLESYGDVRELLMHFRTRADTEDIEPALRTTLRKFQLQTGLTTEIDIQGHGVALPNDVQVQVLHIVQEALSNVRKHAGARQVSVQVQQAPHWRFTVADDGEGFNTQSRTGEDHVGLRIMAERAARIGARLEVRSTPGRGTAVILTVAPPACPQDTEIQDAAYSTAGG